jgi:deoxyinosine 3'endonuclease (endonuclease V)
LLLFLGEGPLDFRYIPGFLAFREVPHLLALLGEARIARPDLPIQVILLDGNGILHPRGASRPE